MSYIFKIKYYNPDLTTDNVYLILNKSLLTNKGWGKRYSCSGK